MRVAVIGGGPVGLVSGAVLASVGHQVTVADIDASRIAHISRGEPPFHEPGLPALLRDVVQAGRLRATLVTADAVADAEAILICVGTPPTGNGADLSALRAASAAVGAALRGRGRVRCRQEQRRRWSSRSCASTRAWAPTRWASA
jgi:UDPglucose 6-dehydrogenase